MDVRKLPPTRDRSAWGPGTDRRGHQEQKRGTNGFFCGLYPGLITVGAWTSAKNRLITRCRPIVGCDSPRRFHDHRYRHGIVIAVPANAANRAAALRVHGLCSRRSRHRLLCSCAARFCNGSLEIFHARINTTRVDQG